MASRQGHSHHSCPRAYFNFSLENTKQGDTSGRVAGKEGLVRGESLCRRHGDSSASSGGSEPAQGWSAEPRSDLSSDRGLTGDGAACVQKRGPEGQLPPSGAQPPPAPLVSLNNSRGLLFPPDPSLQGTSATLPGLPFFRGEVAGRGQGQREEGLGPLDDRVNKGDQHAP